MAPPGSRAWLFAIAASAASACTIDHASSSGGGGFGAVASSSSSAGTGGAGGSAPAKSPRDFFEKNVLPGLMAACGGCHQSQGSADAAFLAAPDPYESITSWPGIIVDVPAQSILITHPADPTHGSGQAPDIPEDLKPKVLAWLALEAAALPKPDAEAGTYIPPFKPLLSGAFNTVYLDPLGPDLANASISFNASAIGDPPTLLRLTNLQVHPVEGMTLHIVHPLFTVYPQNGPADPDPVDSESNVDQTFTLESDPTLGTGEIILANWSEGAWLGLAFESASGTNGGGGTVHCKDVPSFVANAVPAMTYCADTCHGGKKAEAKAAMDLSTLGGPDPKIACDQVRARITPQDPDTSQILIVTDPTQAAVHMYKFMGNTKNYKAFKDAVTPWIMAEPK